MKKLLVSLTGCSLALWLAVPAHAQRGLGGQLRVSAGASSRANLGGSHLGVASHTSTSARVEAQTRSNKKGKLRGKERAEAAQTLNAGADAHRGSIVASGVERAEAQTKGGSGVKADAQQQGMAEASAHQSAHAKKSEQSKSPKSNADTDRDHR